MADNVAITAGSGTNIATDDAGAGGHVQILKLAISTDGSATVIPADAAQGLDVDVTRVQGTVAVVGAGADNAAVVGSPVRIAGKDSGANTQDIQVDWQGAVLVKPSGNTGAQTIVASTTTPNTTLIAADANRVGLIIFNDSTATLFVLLGAGTESATVWSVKIGPDGYYEVPNGFASMRASGHWSAANGNARITAAA